MLRFDRYYSGDKSAFNIFLTTVHVYEGYFQASAGATISYITVVHLLCNKLFGFATSLTQL